MPWWHFLPDFMKESKIDEVKKPPGFVPWTARLKNVLFEEALDIIYFFLGVFTYFYIGFLALLYFGKLWGQWHFISFFVEALAEPYLGAVAIYVILKESRKRKYNAPSKHKGEFFVFFWGTLCILAIGSAAIFEVYTLDPALKIIVKSAVAIGLIYLAGIIHKP